MPNRETRRHFPVFSERSAKNNAVLGISLLIPLPLCEASGLKHAWGGDEPNRVHYFNEVTLILHNYMSCADGHLSIVYRFVLESSV